jgi:hypothetical protein
MTRHANRLSALLTPAIAVLWAAAAVPAPAANHPALNGQAGSPIVLAAKEVFIRGGCPYNLDKICLRDRNGKLVHCRCAS